MLTVTDGGSLTRVLRTSIDPHLKRLLIERRDQLHGQIEGEARFIVVQPADGLDALETALGFSILQNQTDGSRFGDPEFLAAAVDTGRPSNGRKTFRCLRALP